MYCEIYLFVFHGKLYNQTPQKMLNTPSVRLKSRIPFWLWYFIFFLVEKHEGKLVLLYENNNLYLINGRKYNLVTSGIWFIDYISERWVGLLLWDRGSNEYFILPLSQIRSLISFMGHNQCTQSRGRVSCIFDHWLCWN